jgi:hypothetical protein
MHDNERSHLLATDSLMNASHIVAVQKQRSAPQPVQGASDTSGGLANDLKIHRFVYRFAMSCLSRLVWRLFSLCRATRMMCPVFTYNIKLRSLQTLIDIASRSLLSFFPNFRTPDVVTKRRRPKCHFSLRRCGPKPVRFF